MLYNKIPFNAFVRQAQKLPKWRFNLAQRGIYARRPALEAEPAAYRGGGHHSEVITIKLSYEKRDVQMHASFFIIDRE